MRNLLVKLLLFVVSGVTLSGQSLSAADIERLKKETGMSASSANSSSMINSDGVQVDPFLADNKRVIEKSTTESSKTIGNEAYNPLSDDEYRPLSPKDMKYSSEDETAFDPKSKSVKGSSEPLSPIENMFHTLTDGKVLKQFGYDYLKEKGASSITSAGKGYFLGPGDILHIYIWGDPVDIGELEAQYKVSINSNGSIYFPSVGVVPVTGKSVTELENILVSSLKSKFRKFNLEAVVGDYRKFSVSVSGMVQNPGRVYASGLSSILDILIAAGGIDKNGSLRDITIRKGQEKRSLDLYDLLLYGDISEASGYLEEGTSIYVGSIGPVTAITGAVKRPGIYELKGDETLSELVEKAGGFMPTALTSSLKVFSYKEGMKVLSELNYQSATDKNFSLSDGSFVIAPTMDSLLENGIVVKGAVRNSGKFDLASYTTLSSLMTSIKLFPDTNIFYGEIKRSRFGQREEYLTFIPRDIIAGISDIDLEPRDEITFYSYEDSVDVDMDRFRDMVLLNGTLNNTIISGWKENMTLSSVLEEKQLSVKTNRTYANIFRRNLEKGNNREEVITFSPEEILRGETDIILHKMDVITFFDKWEHEPISVSGETHNTEVIPYFHGITLLDIFRAIELKKELSQLKVRILQEEETESANGDISTSMTVQSVYLADLLIHGKAQANVKIHPGAKILFQEISTKERDKRVQILGQVKNPSVIPFKEGMRLSEVLEKVGGLREDAYLEGLVLIRNSAREIQREQLNTTIFTLREQLASLRMQAILQGADNESSQALAEQLMNQDALLKLTEEKAEKSLGRIGLTLPSTIKALKGSENDIILEEDDYIFVPKEPKYVLILGNVYNQISLAYKESKTMESYLHDVGGYKDDAGDAYILHANGSITSPESIRWFEKSLEKRPCKPGDVIIVPQELKIPGNIIFKETLTSVTDILYKTSTSVLASYSLLSTMGALND